MARKFFPIAEVKERYGNLSSTYIYREIKAGRFPQPYKMGTRSMWAAADLDAHDKRLTTGVDNAITTEANASLRKTKREAVSV